MDGWQLRRTFTWRGHAVRWDLLGEGPPVVLCHGTPWSSYTWRRLARAVAPHRSVYLWDMVGFGASAKPDADVSLAAQGRLLADLVDHWGLDRPDVVAHDIGGAVALRAHLLGRVAVRSLALVDVVALAPWGSPFYRLVQDHAEVFAALPPNLHQALVREYIAGASHRGLAPEVHDALVAPWLGDEGQAAFYRQIAWADQAHTDEIEPRYPDIGAPTLVVWGTEDAWIPVDRAHRLHRLIPDSLLELVTDAGHLVMEDRPEEVVGILTGWLQR